MPYDAYQCTLQIDLRRATGRWCGPECCDKCLKQISRASCEVRTPHRDGCESAPNRRACQNPCGHTPIQASHRQAQAKIHSTWAFMLKVSRDIRFHSPMKGIICNHAKLCPSAVGSFPYTSPAHAKLPSIHASSDQTSKDPTTTEGTVGRMPIKAYLKQRPNRSQHTHPRYHTNVNATRI